MRIQEQSKVSTGCMFASQPACKCSQGCVKNAGIDPSNLYAAEFMLYAFHFAHQMEAPVSIIMKKTRTNRQS